MAAGPEVLGKGGQVGSAHGLDALVDDTESVVGPEIAARVGEVAVFKEKLVAEADVEHELVLGVLVGSCDGGINWGVGGMYWWGDELGYHLVHLCVPLYGVPVLDAQGIEKCVRAIAKVFPGVIAPYRVLIIGKTLYVEQLPGCKCVVDDSASSFSPDFDSDISGGFTAK